MRLTLWSIDTVLKGCQKLPYKSSIQQDLTLFFPASSSSFSLWYIPEFACRARLNPFLSSYPCFSFVLTLLDPVVFAFTTLVSPSVLI